MVIHLSDLDHKIFKSQLPQADAKRHIMRQDAQRVSGYVEGYTTVDYNMKALPPD